MEFFQALGMFVAAMWLGSNSVRLFVVRFKPKLNLICWIEIRSRIKVANSIIQNSKSARTFAVAIIMIINVFHQSNLLSKRLKIVSLFKPPHNLSAGPKHLKFHSQTTAKKRVCSTKMNIGVEWMSFSASYVLFSPKCHCFGWTFGPAKVIW